jgi:hypothetical protein
VFLGLNHFVYIFVFYFNSDFNQKNILFWQRKTQLKGSISLLRK